MSLVSSNMLHIFIEGSFRYLTNQKTNAQKSQPTGFPVAGWIQIDRISEMASCDQALSAAQVVTGLPIAATGHTHTRGEGVILVYVSKK